MQPEIASQLRERKLANLRATEPELVAAGNIGCLTQLGGGGLPVVHTVELLDWMQGGPRPAALDQVGRAQPVTPAQGTSGDVPGPHAGDRRTSLGVDARHDVDLAGLDGIDAGLSGPAAVKEAEASRPHVPRH